jgi:hypothetical protein
MTRRAFRFPAPSFPNSIWERFLILAKFHFALTCWATELRRQGRSQMEFGNEGAYD